MKVEILWLDIGSDYQRYQEAKEILRDLGKAGYKSAQSMFKELIVPESKFLSVQDLDP